MRATSRGTNFLFLFSAAPAFVRGDKITIVAFIPPASGKEEPETDFPRFDFVSSVIVGCHVLISGYFTVLFFFFGPRSKGAFRTTKQTNKK